METISLQIKVNAAEAQATLKEIRSAIKDIQTKAVKPVTFTTQTSGLKEAEKSVESLNNKLGQTSTLWNDIVKNAKWQVLSAATSAAIGAFKEALTTMKSVDDEMVTIRKVTGATTEELQKLEAQAYKTASAYGEAADEYLSSVSAFSRAGYGSQASALAELATKTQIVGDTDAKTAQQFLLSVDAAYKYQGSIESLSRVLDGANEIDNKYATSIEKIAEGLGKVVPIASQAHVGVDELTAAIGTITAVTQRSGTEAATALRALFLNIIGDTKTEIDEGVTWTTGEIAGLRDLIKVYAKDAYDLAQATGEVINPMKAIEGLSQSMKDGLLTEQQLMEMVSDIGGKLRTSQLLALIQNWDMYQSMLGDYANALGSADKEVENALDSWSRKTEILKNKWTEFISHLVETDAIKGALDGVIKLVELLDTDVGRFVVTAAAATAGFAVLVKTVKSLKGLELVKDVKAFGGVLIDAAKGSGTLSDSLGLLNLKSLAVVGGIAALVALIMGLKQMYEATFPTAESFTASINEANEKIKTNKERLDEINNIPWNERTEAILSEKKALEEENEELEKNIELTEQRSVSAAKTALFGSEGSAAYVAGGTALGGFRPGGDADSTATTEANIKAAQEYIAVLREEGQLTDEQNIKVQDLLETMQERAAYYEILKNHSSELNESELEKLDLLAQEAQSYEDLVSAYDQAVYGAEALINAYVELNNNTYITEETYQRLIGIYPQLADAATKTADGYEIQRSALENLMSAEQKQQAEAQNTVSKLLEEAQQAGKTGQAMYDYAASLITASNTQLNVSQQMAALQALAAQAGYTKAAIAEVMGFDETSVMNQIRSAATGLMRSGKAKTSEEAMRMAKANYMSGLWGSLTKNYTPAGTSSGSYSSSGGGYRGGSGGSGSSSSSDAANRKKAQAAIKALQKERDAELDVLQKQIDALKEQADVEDRQAKIEEYKLNILKKQDALMNARNERTVRQYNAATGQWEWIANPEKVKKAQEELEDAKKDLHDYERKVELDLAVEELKTRQEAIKAAYQIKIDAWQDYLDGLSGAVFSESQYLNQSVANNQAAANAASKAREDYLEKMGRNHAAVNRINSGETGGSAPSAGGSSTRDNEAAEKQDETRTPANLLKIGAARGGTRPARGTYNNMGIGSDLIKAMQKWYGATQDGKWDGGSYDAANNRTADSAYNLWKAYRNQYLSFSKFKSGTGYYDEGGILRGMGGIKATPQDEIVLPPKLAAKMLTPQADRTFKARLGELGFLYGAENKTPRTLTSSSDNRSYTDHSGAEYHVENITLTEGQAEGLTVAEMCRIAHHVKPYGG